MASSLSPPCFQVSPYVRRLRYDINVHPPPQLPFFSTQLHARILHCSATGNHSTPSLADAIGEEERKREVLESYGLDPSEFGSTSSKRFGRKSRKGRRDEVGRRRKEADVVPPEKPKPPRTTHRLLHVLGGKVRRKNLLSPKGMDVRPMMELVRGAAFDIMQVAGGCPASLRPGRWLDLYSGTGSVGIEALSRGCTEAHFVEMDPWVVSEVLRPNLQWTGFLDVSSIHMIPVENFLQNTENSLGGDGSFDYISVTPPYTVVDYSILMCQLEKSPLVGENTFILVEYPMRTMMPDSCGHLVKIADRRFGRTQLAIYGPNWAQKKKKRSKTSKRKAALL